MVLSPFPSVKCNHEYIKESVQDMHTVLALSGFDVTTVTVVRCEYDQQVYLNFSTTATKLHGLSLHNIIVVLPHGA